MKPGSTLPDWVPPEPGPAELAQALLAGDRVALARGITLVESRLTAHREAAEELLALVNDRAGAALRIGITGVPGAGKSTFIDTLGLQLCESGSRVAVLSVDPSSPVTGGSLLGDKTRMERLSRHPAAFIRPSPSGCALGGVAWRTRETIALCAAAGFDTVLVETVGVGQSEVLVRDMVDCFLVLLLAGAGDELQGLKKGIIELADLLVVNKADGDNRTRAEAVRQEFSRARHCLAGKEGAWQPPVLACSAQTGEGVAAVWATVEKLIEQARARGDFAARRGAQQLTWLEDRIEAGLKEIMLADPAVRAARAEMARLVVTGALSPPAGARRLLAMIAKR